MSLKKSLNKRVIPDLSNIIIRYCNHYEITLDHRYVNGELEYLVKYPSWSSEWNEWISHEDHVDISMLSDYWNGTKKKKNYNKKLDKNKKWGVKTRKPILVDIITNDSWRWRIKKITVEHHKGS
jgi:hypothetical protein